MPSRPKALTPVSDRSQRSSHQMELVLQSFLSNREEPGFPLQRFPHLSLPALGPAGGTGGLAREEQPTLGLQLRGNSSLLRIRTETVEWQKENLVYRKPGTERKEESNGSS